MKSFHVCSASSCEARENDISWIYDYLINNSYEHLDDFRKADFIFLSTCANHAENAGKALRSTAYYYKRKKQNAKLILLGCLPKISPNSLSHMKDLIHIAPDGLSNVDEVIRPVRKLEDIRKPLYVKHFGLAPYLNFINTLTHELNQAYYFILADRKSLYQLMRKFNARRIMRFFKDRYSKEQVANSDTYYLEVARGCSGLCTYCAIPRAVGPQKSRPISDILLEFESAVKNGFTRIRIAAGNLGSYGQDIDSSLVELLDEVLKTPGDYRLRIGGINPRDFISQYDRLTAILEKNKDRIRTIRIPVQSGSAKVLHSVNRSCNFNKFTQCLTDFKRRLPDILLRTHIIVGLPGETEEDFLKTFKFVESFGFSFVRIHKYSRRPNTKAAEMDNHVSGRTVVKRMKRLEEVQSKYGESEMSFG